MGFLPWKIALRYLKSKKSHGAVSAIGWVSVAGVAIATAAVVCVLSVFNGFKESLTERFDIMAPDIVVSPVQGKAFSATDSLIGAVAGVNGVHTVMPVVEEKALAIYGGRELPVTIKGVDTEKFAEVTAIKGSMLPGSRLPADYYEEMPEFEYYEDYEEYVANTPKPEALASIGASARLGHMEAGDNFLLFAPRREGRYNPANPAASFVMDSVRVSGIYEARQKDYDEDMVVVPVGLARHLFQYDDEATALEVKVEPGFDPSLVKRGVEAAVGSKYGVKDRAEMQQLNFRMVNIEKWVSYLLLFFILVIATFNIISTMTMLVLEKRRQMAVLNSMGMNRGSIASVFRNESVVVSVAGGLLGVALGVALCLLQEHCGLIKISGDPSTLLMTVYPVKLLWEDVLVAFLPSVVLGVATSFIAGAFARSRITSNPAAASA